MSRFNSGCVEQPLGCRVFFTIVDSLFPSAISGCRPFDQSQSEQAGRQAGWPVGRSAARLQLQGRELGILNLLFFGRGPRNLPRTRVELFFVLGFFFRILLQLKASRRVSEVQARS